MTSPLDDFDYRSVDLESRPCLYAHCWKALALLRSETYYNFPDDKAAEGLEILKRRLNWTEAWSGLYTSPKGYTSIILCPIWPNIDKGAMGLKLIDQFFPHLTSMTFEDWNDPLHRKRLTGILRHTDAIPMMAAVQVMLEDKIGNITRHTYKGT